MRTEVIIEQINQLDIEIAICETEINKLRKCIQEKKFARSRLMELLEIRRGSHNE